MAATPRVPACVIDGRGMEPPEPFERVMAALAQIDAGEQVLLILPREPFPLYRVLEGAGFAWQTKRPGETADGVFEILIGRNA
jgi:tRNA 2-thiouridine synthesizing protein A